MKVKGKRIIFYYALAIFLPCFFLGILAFRGIKNDQALVEREQIKNCVKPVRRSFRIQKLFLGRLKRYLQKQSILFLLPGNWY